jgi:hypothetical protein
MKKLADSFAQFMASLGPRLTLEQLLLEQRE